MADKEIGLNSGVRQHRYDVDYLVLFQYENNKTWAGKLFGHVFLWRNITEFTSIKINHTFQGTQIIPYTSNINLIYNDLQKYYNCYVWKTKDEDFHKTNMNMLCTCVSEVKRMLGIRAWWIITPKQLERYLIKKGC